MQRLSSLRNPSCFRNPFAKARERTGPRACARGVDSRRQHSCGAAKARRRQLGITRPASCLPRTVRKLSRRSATGPFFRRCSITRCGAKSSADSRCGIQARTTRRAASQGRRQGREDAVSAIARGGTNELVYRSATPTSPPPTSTITARHAPGRQSD